jgi:hypothetical protein
MWGMIGLLTVSTLHLLSLEVPFGQENALAVGLIFGFASYILFDIFRPTAPQIKIQPLERSGWSWTRMQQAILQFYGQRTDVAPWVVIALVFLLNSLVFGLYGGLRYGGSFGLHFGLVGGLVSIVVIYLFSYLPFGLTTKEEVESTHPHPNQGIWRSAWSGLRIGVVGALIIGIVSGLGVGVVGGVSKALLLGTFLGFLGGLDLALGTGGKACLQHATLRWLLWRSGAVPWNYVRFLNSAAELSLLRKVGGGYTFVHRLLLEHFALLGLASQQDISSTIPQQRTLSTYRGHSNSVRALSWSPDGTLIASWSDDKTIQVWNTSTAEKTWSCDYTDAVIELGWSSDNWLVASRNAQNVIQIWDLTTSSSRDAEEDEGMTLAALSPDSSRFPSWTRTRTNRSLSRLVRIWNPSTGDPLLTYRGHSKYVHTMAWSPDGTRIASGGWDKTAQIWNVTTGETLLTYQDHPGGKLALVWSPDGKNLASLGGDLNESTVHVWNAQTAETLLIEPASSSPLSNLAWSPDGTRLAFIGSTSHSNFLRRTEYLGIWEEKTREVKTRRPEWLTNLIFGNRTTHSTKGFAHRMPYSVALSVASIRHPISFCHLS